MTPASSSRLAFEKGKAARKMHSPLGIDKLKKVASKKSEKESKGTALGRKGSKPGSPKNEDRRLSGRT